MDKKNMNDDLGPKKNKVVEQEQSALNTNDLQDKWNRIQDEYMQKHPDIDMDDLYFEGGGFNGLLEKISDETGKSISEIKEEIENW